MNITQEFDGYYYKPSQEKVITLVLILEYMRMKYSFKNIAISRNSPDIISEHKIKNARYHLSFEPDEFQEITKQVFNFFTKKVTSTNRVKYIHLDSGDDFIKHIVIPFFPQLGELIKGETREYEPLMMNYATAETIILKEFAEKFPHGAYIYRYAKNSHQKHKLKPRIAKGYITISPKLNFKHLDFEMKYRAQANEKRDSDTDLVVRGRVYIIHGYVFFVGIGVEHSYPFLMVMPNKFASQRNGALILRKHYDQGYFASKVMISRNQNEVVDAYEQSGKFEASALPDLNESQLISLLNLADNDGRSGLSIPDF